MKRIKKICLTILLTFFGLFLFTACTDKERVESISLNGYSEEMPLQVCVGKFSYDEYTLTVTYDNGGTQEIALQEDMISETDKLKFFQEGKREITISYQGATTTVWVDVQRNVFPESVQLKSVRKTYTGEIFTIEVEGDIPGGTKVVYPQGNTFQNAGSYDMTAVLQCDGYVTKTLSATVVIEKAAYDLSNARLYDQTFVYDKEAHGITLKGKKLEDVGGTAMYEQASLPKGVSVSYTITKIMEGDGVTAIPAEKQQTKNGNAEIDAGTYKVCAKFTGDDKNYQPIPDSVAYITIKRASYDMSAVTLTDKTFVYTGESYSLFVEENGKLPYDVEISYQIKQVKNGKGEEVDSAYAEGNSKTDAGTYSVKAIFTIKGRNAANYVAEPCEIEATLTILRAEYDSQMGNLYLDLQEPDSEGNKEYELWLSGELPTGVLPIFTLLNENGERVEGRMEKLSSEDEGNETKNPLYKYVFTADEEGIYTCVVTFTHNDTNYKEIQLEIEAWMFIGSDQ